MSGPLSILVVEDDDALRDALQITLEAAGHQAIGVDGGAAALAQLREKTFHMVVSDLRMSPMDGLTLLGEIRAHNPGLPVLLMTAFGDVDKAVAAIRGGACDFMLKPFEPKALIEQIARYATPPAPAADVVAVDPKTRATLLLAARVARSDATVLLTGESGVGKEVFARYIHEQSLRSAGGFIAINCAAIPNDLLEATLFGYEKGAFTGAHAAQAGKFEQANGGTLLLDEISEMPLGLQAKLLRVLQEREVERVGGKKPVALDIRVLATSNRDMAEAVQAGRFREDLFYRLNVFPLDIPPLRERPGDIVPLARKFLAKMGSTVRQAARFTAAAEARLSAYSWPGNVRELQNVVQRALILAAGELIEASELPLGSAVIGSGTGAISLPDAGLGAAPCAVSPTPTFPEVLAETGSPTNIKVLERQHILETLTRVNGSRKQAVAILGISERTLRYKLNQYRTEGFLAKADLD